jgi:molecular chaperone GrpE (heat shock protein)
VLTAKREKSPETKKMEAECKEAKAQNFRLQEQIESLKKEVMRQKEAAPEALAHKAENAKLLSIIESMKKAQASSTSPQKDKQLEVVQLIEKMTSLQGTFENHIANSKKEYNQLSEDYKDKCNEVARLEKLLEDYQGIAFLAYG